MKRIYYTPAGHKRTGVHSELTYRIIITIIIIAVVLMMFALVF